MREISFLIFVVSSILFSSCASKEKLEEEPTKATVQEQEKVTSSPEPEMKPPVPGDDLGLLDPKDLTKLPTESDMRSTAPKQSKPIVVSPVTVPNEADSKEKGE